MLLDKLRRFMPQGEAAARCLPQPVRYSIPNRGNHGFQRSSAGTFTSLDFPSAAYAVATCLNDSGDVAGYFADSNALLHSFLHTAKGTTIFEAPVPPLVWHHCL